MLDKTVSEILARATEAAWNSGPAHDMEREDFERALRVFMGALKMDTPPRFKGVVPTMEEGNVFLWNKQLDEFISHARI
jgi:hypothetical protein